MNDHRLNVLEQQFQVLSGEMSGVLREMQVTMEGMAKTYSMAIKMLLQRVDVLEKQLPSSIRTEETGKEL